VTVLGHIAGIPVEETLASFAPVGAVGIGALLYTARGRAALVRRLARRIARAARRATGLRPPAGSGGLSGSARPGQPPP
jgi:hypothetical protein